MPRHQSARAIDSGTITIDGEVLPEEGRKLAQLRSDVGMVFQSFNLFAHKTILDNVTLAPMKVRKMSKEEAREKPWRCWSGSTSLTKRTSTRRSCPAASSSGWRSRGRWRSTPRSCCSTSRPARSTRR